MRWKSLKVPSQSGSVNGGEGLENSLEAVIARPEAEAISIRQGY